MMRTSLGSLALLRPAYVIAASFGFLSFGFAGRSHAADAETLKTHTRWVAACAFSPDGKTLATVGGESLLYRPGDVDLWDPATGTLKAALAGHETSVWSLAFSADGKQLATGG